MLSVTCVTFIFRRNFIEKTFERYKFDNINFIKVHYTHSILMNMWWNKKCEDIFTLIIMIANSGWRQTINFAFWKMGNICCGDTSTDNFKTNGKIRGSQSDEENSLQGSNQEPLELQHISEREYGMSLVFLSHVTINLLLKMRARIFCF